MRIMGMSFYKDIDNTGIYLRESGLKLANKYERIVSSSRGSYVEINPDDIVMKLKLKFPEPDDDPDFYYYWMYPAINGLKDVKIYLQIKKVKYADYRINYYYININDVKLPKQLEINYE